MRVNIVGSAPGYEDAPVNAGYLWGVNNVHWLLDLDLIVDIHKNRLAPVEQKDKDHMADLEKKNIPTYANDLIPGQPHIMKYPIDEVIEYCGSDYFGSGIDYLIALAIYKGATSIHIYGVMMAKGSEYEHQLPSVSHWLGIAIGRGIKVKVHGKKTSLLRTRNGLRYGYGTPQNWMRKQKPEQAELIDILNNYDYTVCDQVG